MAVKKKETKVAIHNQLLPLQQMVDQELENRKILTKFISDQMKDGTDFGSILIKGKKSKPSLFKAGAEKIGSLMKLRPDCIMDEDTWKMAGSVQGLFCYKCYLYDPKNDIVGMGLGACSVQEKGSYNNAIKIAKKRAFVDAILTTGALSDFFTQDLEDQHVDNPVYIGHGVSVPTEKTLISSKQRSFIFNLIERKGKTKDELDDFIWRATNKGSITELTWKEASNVIDKLMQLPDQMPLDDGKEPEINVDEVAAAIDTQ